VRWRLGAQAQVDAGPGGRPDDRELAAPSLQGDEALPGLHGYLAWPAQGLGYLDQPVQDGAQRGPIPILGVDEVVGSGGEEVRVAGS
jgi:hypothetical protein